MRRLYEELDPAVVNEVLSLMEKRSMMIPSADEIKVATPADLLKEKSKPAKESEMSF